MVLKNRDNGIVQTWQKGEPCRGADIAVVFSIPQYAQEQPQWSDRTSESTSPWLPTCGNRDPPTSRDCPVQSLNWRLCCVCMYPLCIHPFMPPLRPLPPCWIYNTVAKMNSSSFSCLTTATLGLRCCSWDVLVDSKAQARIPINTPRTRPRCQIPLLTIY